MGISVALAMRRAYPWCRAFKRLAGGEADGQQGKGGHHAEVGAHRGAGTEARGARAGTRDGADEKDRRGDSESEPEDGRHCGGDFTGRGKRVDFFSHSERKSTWEGC